MNLVLQRDTGHGRPRTFGRLLDMPPSFPDLDFPYGRSVDSENQANLSTGQPSAQKFSHTRDVLFYEFCGSVGRSDITPQAGSYCMGDVSFCGDGLQISKEIACLDSIQVIDGQRGRNVSAERLVKQPMQQVHLGTIIPGEMNIHITTRESVLFADSSISPFPAIQGDHLAGRGDEIPPLVSKDWNPYFVLFHSSTVAQECRS